MQYKRTKKTGKNVDLKYFKTLKNLQEPWRTIDQNHFEQLTGSLAASWQILKILAVV